MPYGISQSQSDCSMWATVAQTASGAYETVGCHAVKQDAIDHMVAAALATDTETLGQVDERSLVITHRAEPNLTPPEYMRDSARRGLELHEQGLSGDGLMPQTVADARRMVAGEVSEAKWRKIAPWIARHMVDLEAIDGDEITAGLVAHLLWGSSGTKSGATRAMNYAQSVVDALDKRSSENKTTTNTGIVSTITMVTTQSEQRELPPSYRPSSSDDVPVIAPACASCEYFCILEDTPEPHCARWGASVRADMYCDAYEMKEDYHMEEMPTMVETPEIETNSATTFGWVAVAKDEKRHIAYSNMEVRAEGEDGTTLVGYAAVFDTPSLDMGFTEYVSRGAFTKTLKDGADVRLLLDHEGAPLARTRSGTLRLSEDERGLRVEADLDPTNPMAQTVLSALRRGDMNQMSFAFRTIRDSWNSNRSVRELREVQLYDVSVVTFPAYEATIAEVRASQSVTITSTSRARTRKAQTRIAIANLDK